MSDEKRRETPKFDYSGGFQTRILRVLYQNQDLACTIGVHLSHEHFDTPARQWLGQKIVDHARKHGAGISEDALKIELARDIKVGRFRRDQVEKARGLIKGLSEPVKDRSYVQEELFRFIKHQSVRNAIVNIVDGGMLDRGEFDDIDAELGRAVDVKEALGGGLGHFFVRDRAERRARRKAYVKNGVSTGLKYDDYSKAGGLPPKAIGTIVAPSGVGKTSSLVHVGASAVIHSEAPVLYVTTELSVEMISDKFDAHFSHVSLNILEQRRNSVSRKVRELGQRYGEFLVVKEFPPATLTPRGLRAYVKQLERVGFYPKLIVVDSADDMIPDEVGRERDSYEDYGNVWRGLRRVSYEVNAPIWTASQTQRGALNKEHVDWDKTADSAKKIMVSDVVLIMQQTLKEQKRKQARVHIAKNRFGSAKIEFPVRLDWSRCIIQSL